MSMTDHLAYHQQEAKLREKLVLAEKEARETARIYHGDFAKGLRVGFALALQGLDDGITWDAEYFWTSVRRESREFEAEALRLRQGHKG